MDNVHLYINLIQDQLKKKKIDHLRHAEQHDQRQSTVKVWRVDIPAPPRPRDLVGGVRGWGQGSGPKG